METTGRPAFVTLADNLRRKITSGEWQPGYQLPSFAQLMADNGVSNTVVRSAVNLLKGEGLLVGQQGRGVFVRDRGPDRTNDGDLAQDVATVRADLDRANDELRRLAERLQAIEAAIGAPEQGR